MDDNELILILYMVRKIQGTAIIHFVQFSFSLVSLRSLATVHTPKFGREFLHDIQYFDDMLELKSLASTQSK